jgi:hypothetical protein
MSYFIRFAVILAGGTASIVAYNETSDFVFPAIIIFLLIAGFVAVLVWRIYHLENEQKTSRD